MLPLWVILQKNPGYMQGSFGVYCLMVVRPIVGLTDTVQLILVLAIITQLSSSGQFLNFTHKKADAFTPAPVILPV